MTHPTFKCPEFSLLLFSLLIFSNVLYIWAAFRSCLRSKDKQLAELSYIGLFIQYGVNNRQRILCIKIILNQPCLALPPQDEWSWESQTVSVLWLWETALICYVIRTFRSCCFLAHAWVFGCWLQELQQHKHHPILPPSPCTLAKWYIRMYAQR